MSYARRSTNDCRRIFNEYFHSVIVRPKSELAPAEELEPSNNSILNIKSIEITEARVRKRLKIIDVNKIAGSDVIHLLLIRHCADSLTIPVTFIFNFSFYGGSINKIRRRAFATPTPKDPVSQNIDSSTIDSSRSFVILV